MKETTDLCNIEKIQSGSVWTRHDSGEVVKVEGNDVYLKNNKGDVWTITKTLVASQFNFADQYEQTIELTRTELIILLKENRRTAMTVTFHKKPDGKAISKLLRDGQGSMTDRAWLIHINKILLGEERTMMGHHFGSFDDHERLRFREHGKGSKLVDTRTLTRIIVNQINYVQR